MLAWKLVLQRGALLRRRGPYCLRAPRVSHELGLLVPTILPGRCLYCPAVLQSATSSSLVIVDELACTLLTVLCAFTARLYCLQSATSSSLVIVDELGRGTSTW